MKFDPTTGEQIVIVGGSSGGSSTPPILGGSSFTTNQVSVGATATQIVAAEATRTGITVVNHGTTAVYLGGPSVTTGTGVLLAGVVGAAATVLSTGAVWGIVASGSQTVGYLDVLK